MYVCIGVVNDLYFGESSAVARNVVDDSSALALRSQIKGTNDCLFEKNGWPTRAE